MNQNNLSSFGHDEEVGGTNGAAAVNYLKEKGIKAAMTIDEGGLLENLIDGLNNPIAMVNLAEKGFASFRLIARLMVDIVLLHQKKTP